MANNTTWRRIEVAAFVVAAVFAVDATAQEATRPKPIDDPDSYAVYASLLPNQWTVRSAKAKTLVFQQETTTDSHCLPSGPPLDGSWREVMDGFRRENASARILLAGRDLGIPYVVVPSAEIHAAFSRRSADPNLGWDGFYARYPESGGYMQVSAVGFDAARMRALVYVAHSCGSLCGGGTYYFLEKSDERWREVRVPDIRSCMWAS